MRHWQLFARAWVMRPLRTTARADDFMRAAVSAAGMNIISGPHSTLGIVPGNEGVSSTCILDLSSANLHEWPDAHPFPAIHFDLFTCGKRPERRRFFELFSDLELRAFDIRILDRDEFLGIPNPL